VELVGPVEPIGRIEMDPEWLGRRFVKRPEPAPPPTPTLPELEIPRYGGREYSPAGLFLGALVGFGIGMFTGSVFLGFGLGIPLALVLGTTMGRSPS